MAEEKTAEVKLAEAEAKLTEVEGKMQELQTKLDSIPNNPDHFNQLKTERDEAKKKLKELEDAKAEANGEFERLANERLAELEKEKTEKENLKAIADKWTDYEKARREKLLAELTDEKVKKMAEKLTSLEDLEEFVELHKETKPGTGSSNHQQRKKQDDEPKTMVKYKTT